MTILREIRPTRKYATNPDRFDDDRPGAVEPETRAATDAERALLKTPYRQQVAAEQLERSQLTAILERAMTAAGLMPTVHRDGVITVGVGSQFWTCELETFIRVPRNA